MSRSIDRWALFAVACACATIDRIEAENAVVEWPDGRLSDVPLLVLPPHAREGDRLRFVLDPASDAASSLPVVASERESPRSVLVPTHPRSTPQESGHERQ